MLTGCLKNDLHDIKNFTLFKKISKIFQKSLDFSIFLCYNQLTNRHEYPSSRVQVSTVDGTISRGDKTNKRRLVCRISRRGYSTNRGASQ